MHTKQSGGVFSQHTDPYAARPAFGIHRCDKVKARLIRPPDRRASIIQGCRLPINEPAQRPCPPAGQDEWPRRAAVDCPRPKLGALRRKEDFRWPVS